MGGLGFGWALAGEWGGNVMGVTVASGDSGYT